MTSRIRRGVSLYSYQDEAFTGRLTLEQMIAASASFGANGIEIIPEQTYDNYSYLTDAFEVDSVEQVRLQHAMLAELLGEGR